MISGGMFPKLEACTQALRKGVGRVRILPAAQAEILPQFYFSQAGVRHGGDWRMSLASVMKSEARIAVARLTTVTRSSLRKAGAYISGIRRGTAIWIFSAASE